MAEEPEGTLDDAAAADAAASAAAATAHERPQGGGTGAQAAAALAATLRSAGDGVCTKLIHATYHGVASCLFWSPT